MAKWHLVMATGCAAISLMLLLFIGYTIAEDPVSAWAIDLFVGVLLFLFGLITTIFVIGCFLIFDRSLSFLLYPGVNLLICAGIIFQPDALRIFIKVGELAHLELNSARYRNMVDGAIAIDRHRFAAQSLPSWFTTHIYLLYSDADEVTILRTIRRSDVKLVPEAEFCSANVRHIRRGFYRVVVAC